MNNLVNRLERAKHEVFGIGNIVSLSSSVGADERAIVKLSKVVKSDVKRILIERVASGWWVVRFYKDDGSDIEKDTFKEGDISEIMSRAVLGSQTQNLTLH